MENKPPLSVSDLVRWFDYYEDRIVRDAGLGVVVESGGYGGMYLVYRFEHNNTMWYERHDLTPAAEINAPVPER
tara:strand:+ start:787 stop:1008 length:222 start_codon:yes stop_codon:yes gene_type:complete